MSGCRAPFKDILRDITLPRVGLPGASGRFGGTGPRVTPRHATPRSREPRWPHGIGQWPHEIIPSEPPRGVMSNERAIRYSTERRRERTVGPPQAIWDPPRAAMRAHAQDNAALSRVEISSYPRVDIALNPVTYSNWYVKARAHSMKDASCSFIGCLRRKSALERFSTG